MPQQSPVSFRWRVPTPDSQAGEGHVDELADDFAALRARLDAIPADDPYRDALRAAAGTVVNRLEVARRLLWAARDDMHDRLTASQAVIDGEAQRTAASTPQVAGNTYGDYALAQTGAADAVRKRAEIAIGAEVVKARASKASTVAGDFGEAWAALCVAVDRAWVDWSGPASLREAADWRLEDLSKEAQAGQEIRAAQPSPMSYALSQITARLSTLTDDEDERQRFDIFVRAARSVALELRDMSPAKVNARYDLQERDAMGERDMALKVLQKLDEQRQSERPESFAVVFASSSPTEPSFMNAVRDLAHAVFGVQLRRAALAEYACRGLAPNMQRVDAPAPWDHMPTETWPTKWLVSSSTAPKLPGWSPIRIRTTAGVPVRLPR